MPLPSIHERFLSGITFKEIRGDPDAPAVIFFHGYGADERDLIVLSQTCSSLSIKPTFYFPRGLLEIPIAPDYRGYGWFPIDIELLKEAVHNNNTEAIHNAFQEFSLVRKQCENWIAELNIPLHKLYLGGFSQGAILATDLALNARENIAGLLIFSGILLNESAWSSLSTKHKGLYFFQSHGKHDPLLPFSQAQALYSLLEEKGLHGTFHAFEGGHEIPHATILKLHTFFRQKLLS